MAVNIYACGGTGMNQGEQFADLTHGDDLDLNVFGFDTSKANMRENTHFTEDNTYLVKNKDGSGQKRAANYEEIMRRLPEAMNKFPAADFNIVVFSTHGGSGSIWGPGIVGHLLEQGKPFVAIAIGSASNKVAAGNNHSTLLTLEGVADANDATVPVMYANHTLSERDQDGVVYKAINCLLMLFSGDLKRMDSADIKNFLQHTTHTGQSGRCNLLTICTEQADVDSISNPLSIASIMQSDKQPPLVSDAIYVTRGYGLDPEVMPDVDALHFVTSETEMDNLLEVTADLKNRTAERAASAVREKPVLSGADSNGFILD